MRKEKEVVEGREKSGRGKGRKLLREEKEMSEERKEVA